MSVPETDGPLEQQLVALGVQEGVSSPERQLLLWVARVWFSRSPEDSHENVLDSPSLINDNVAIDGVVVTEDREICSISLLQYVSAFTRQTTTNLDRLFAYLTTDTQDARSIVRRLATSDRRLRQLLEPAISSRHDDELVLSVAVISHAAMPPALSRKLESLSEDIHVQVLDGPYLKALAVAAREPGTLNEEIRLPLSPGEFLRSQAGANQIYVLPVSGLDIASWPGIEDRRLFDLNVRFALGLNRVRKSLDAALREREDQARFVAYHNGLTVICNEAHVVEGNLVLRGVSVVNGAQSVVALWANRSEITSDLRLLVKVVVVAESDPIAQQIAIRSNTQNPVTTRNLQALDPTQIRLTQELKALNYVFVTRPDSTGPSGPRVLKNDDAAQLLCSLYLERPWLAVKRQVLFETDNYRQIFPPDLDARRVAMAHIIRRSIEQHRGSFPEAYKGAWSLSSLTAVYICGQIMRIDELGRQLLLNPDNGVRDLDTSVARITPFVEKAVQVLRNHHEQRIVDGVDEFKVEFKQQRTLTTLGNQAAKSWRRETRNG